MQCARRHTHPRNGSPIQPHQKMTSGGEQMRRRDNAAARLRQPDYGGGIAAAGLRRRDCGGGFAVENSGSLRSPSFRLLPMVATSSQAQREAAKDRRQNRSSGRTRPLLPSLRAGSIAGGAVAFFPREVAGQTVPLCPASSLGGSLARFGRL